MVGIRIDKINGVGLDRYIRILIYDRAFARFNKYYLGRVFVGMAQRRLVLVLGERKDVYFII